MENRDTEYILINKSRGDTVGWVKTKTAKMLTGYSVWKVIK